MAYKITDDCNNCGACESECPTQAISMGDMRFYVDLEKCTECVGFYDHPQCAVICSNNAAIPDPAHKIGSPETNKGLLDAAQKGDIELVSKFSATANINTANNDGETPLHLAAWNGHDKIVSMLIERGALLNNTTLKGNWTPLHKAAWQGHTKVASILIENHADINAKLSGGDTPLHMAAFHGFTEIVSLLVSKGATVNVSLTSGSDPGTTPLHLASMKGHTQIVSLLLKCDADIHAKLGDNTRREGGYTVSTSGATPLHLAANHNHIDIVELLAEKGANLDAMDHSGATALHYAANMGFPLMIRTLVKLGANVNAMDYYNKTPLSFTKPDSTTGQFLKYILGFEYFKFVPGVLRHPGDELLRYLKI